MNLLLGAIAWILSKPLRGCAVVVRAGPVAMRRAGCAIVRRMEINQIKRFIKELEERTDSLRGYL
jgi:hypothetical protein